MNTVIQTSTRSNKKSLGLNRRQRTLLILGGAIGILSGIVLVSMFAGESGTITNFSIRNLSPSLNHPFGTDWMGRDMFIRSVKGLSLSMGIGALASAVSVLIALFLGVVSATMGKSVDALICWMIDLFLGVPHLVILILIAFCMGGGAKGVVTGVALTHWPSLARIIRAEVLQLKTMEYVNVSRQMGKTPLWIALNHLLPHLLPQLFVGMILMFPHAILHEASITFLGFGLSPHQPAIGIILSESMRYLSGGMWWLALYPGLSLLIMVRSFDILGENMRLMLNPQRLHE